MMLKRSDRDFNGKHRAARVQKFQAEQRRKKAKRKAQKRNKNK